jgi:hypothetical protein
MDMTDDNLVESRIVDVLERRSALVKSALTLDDIRAGTVTPVPKRRTHPWIVVSAAAYAVAVLGSAVVLRHREPSRVRTLDTTTTIASVTTTTATAAPRPPFRPVDVNQSIAVLPPDGSGYKPSVVVYGVNDRSVPEDVRLIAAANQAEDTLVSVTIRDDFMGTYQSMSVGDGVEVHGIETIGTSTATVDEGRSYLWPGSPFTVVQWRVGDLDVSVSADGVHASRSLALEVARSITLNDAPKRSDFKLPSGYHLLRDAIGERPLTQIDFVEDDGVERPSDYKRFTVQVHRSDAYDDLIEQRVSGSIDSSIVTRRIGDVALSVASSDPSENQLASFADSLRLVEVERLNGAPLVLFGNGKPTTRDDRFRGTLDGVEWRMDALIPWSDDTLRTVRFSIGGQGLGGASSDGDSARGIRYVGIAPRFDPTGAETEQQVVYGMVRPDVVRVILRDAKTGRTLGDAVPVKGESTDSGGFAITITTPDVLASYLAIEPVDSSGRITRSEALTFEVDESGPHWARFKP